MPRRPLALVFLREHPDLLVRFEQWKAMRLHWARERHAASLRGKPFTGRRGPGRARTAPYRLASDDTES